MFEFDNVTVRRLQIRQIWAERVDGGQVVHGLAGEKICGHVDAFFVLDGEVEIKHCQLKTIESFGVEVTQFFQWFVISVEHEFATPEVVVVVFHTFNRSGHFEEVGRIVFLSIHQLSGTIGDDVKLLVLIGLSENETHTAGGSCSPCGGVDNEGLLSVWSGIRHNGIRDEGLS